MEAMNDHLRRQKLVDKLVELYSQRDKLDVFCTVHPQDLNQYAPRELRNILRGLQEEGWEVDTANSRRTSTEIKELLEETRSSISCPDCGSEIRPILTFGSWGDVELDSYECSNSKCGGLWDKKGHILGRQR